MAAHCSVCCALLCSHGWVKSRQISPHLLVVCVSVSVHVCGTNKKVSLVSYLILWQQKQSDFCAKSCKSKKCLSKMSEKRKCPFNLCFCQVMHHSPTLPLQFPRLAGTVMSFKAEKDERFCSVYHTGELCDTLALSLSPATMRFPHTRHRIWVSALPPRLSPFILNADKKGEKGGERVGGGEETKKEAERE